MSSTPPTPPTPLPYTHDQAVDDLLPIRRVLALFLSSEMLEAERQCKVNDEKKERLYYQTGWGLIQALKAMMTFEDSDLHAAIEDVRHANTIANQHRRPASSLASRLAGFVVRSGGASGVGFIRGMTNVERHAELVYAESLLQKAVLGIVYSGDWLSFIKEALNMRSANLIYRDLQKFLETVDAEATARGEGPEDSSIDQDFRSGVHLGVGLNSLVLSLLPSRASTIISLFGYKGDRHEALATLAKPGGWVAGKAEPAVSAEDEGLRRPLCDMGLLLFHLVLSQFTYDGVDMKMAQNILNFNLKRFPNGVFFLFAEGRIRSCTSQPELAIASYKRAIEVQSEYVQLQHISLWEQSICYLALWNVSSSLECFRKLTAESNWSKAIYTYGVAACLIQLGREDNIKEGTSLMAKVPELRQKIAGKSIPMEKYVARKARKFEDQGNRLALPALELAYMFQAIGHTSRDVIISKMLPLVDEALLDLKACSGNPKSYCDGHGYWDDFCLATMLKGVCLRFVAYADPDSAVQDESNCSISKADAEAGSFAAFRAVLDNSSKIELDHFLIYHTHFELGRLYSCSGDMKEARVHLELVLSGKALETNSSRKGKYSMQNALVLRAHAAIEALDKGCRL